MSRLDDVLKQIAEVERQIDELPDGDFAHRIELRDRVLDLRAEVGELRAGRDAEEPTDRLLAQLAELRRQRQHLQRKRIDVVKQGTDTRIYLDVDAGLGIAGVEEQITRIEEILDRRGIDHR